MQQYAETEKHHPAPKFDAGPHGVGDPKDQTLRKVELEVLIPKIMRQRAKDEKCIPEVQAFESCCAKSNVFMVMTCRNQNEAMRDCFTKWYKDETFKNECREIYLRDRTEYRKTGLTKKEKARAAAMTHQTT